MPNMSYCRFNNTYQDLRDCLDHLDSPCSEPEHHKRVELVALCAEIVLEWADAESIGEAAAWARELPVEY